jgi:hypothetical protein
MVIKTYVISQAIYVMGILTIGEEYGRRMNEIMIDFLKGGDRTIEARRRNLTAKLGGYGIIDMNIMNLSLKCAWLKRWKNKVNFTDYPKAMMMNNGNVNYECVGVEQAGALGYGIFRDIMEKWRLFKIEYYRRGQNRLEMTIFGNTHVICWGRVQKGLFLV